MRRIFFFLVRCLWHGHDDMGGVNTYRELYNGKMHELTKCMYCDKVLKTVPLLPSGRRHMKCSVTILEDTDGMSGV